MSKVPTIQIAFQGGGAKLISMLPVAAAFKKCHDDGTIKISAVSGASAGSICAALIASDADFSKVVDHICEKGQVAISKIVPNEARRLSDAMPQGLWAKTKFVTTHLPFLYKVAIAGRPILNEKEFGEFIKGLFAYSSIDKIEKTKIKLYINGSDIVQQQNKYFDSGYIYSAVIDSSSIPLAFRSFRALSRSHVVDGGLCQNLPSDILLEKNDKDPIFAVFPEVAEEKKEIGNILEYCFALFSASIAHNVERSRAVISDAFSISVSCDYNTFDFETALKKLQSDSWYKLAVADFEAQIRDFARNYGIVDSNRHFRFSDIDTKDEYVSVVEELTKDYTEYFTYDVSRFQVFVNCDRYLPKKDASYRRPADAVVKTARFTVTKEGFRYFKSGLGMDSQTQKPRPAMWSARNLRSGKELSINVLALTERRNGHLVGKGCIVMFNYEPDEIVVGDQIELMDSSYAPDAMLDMNMRRNDFISMWNMHPKTIGRAELIITFPKKIGKYRMINASKDNSIDDDLVKKIIFDENDLNNLPPELQMIGIYTENLQTATRFQGLAVLDR